jgi:hypothetical protein
MATVDINALYAAQTGSDNDSKKAMLYTADDGATQYRVQISENIGSAMGFGDVETATVADELPRGYVMRKVTFSDATGKVSGAYPCGTPSTPIYVEGGTITVARKGKADGVTCQVTGSQGEKKRFGGANDTGQQSGDVS